MNKNKSLGIIFIAIIGFCLSFFLLINAINNSHSSQDSKFDYNIESYKLFFNENPHFLLWIFTISIILSISLGLLIPVIYKVREIVKEFRLKSLAISLNVFFSLLIMGFIFFILNQNQYLTGGAKIMALHDILLEEPELVMTIIIVVSFIIPLIGITGILIINHSLGLIKTKNLRENIEIKRFILLSKSLDFFLMVIGLIITGGIIATGKQRQSIIGVIGIEQGLVYPIEFVYVYGAFFTVLLAILYIPIYNYLQITGRAIKENANEFSQYEPQNGDNKDNLGNLLKTEQSVFEKLKVSLSIFAPVLGSVIIKILEF